MKMRDDGDGSLISLDGVEPSQIVGVSASVNLPLHHKVQKFSSGTGSPGWSRKKGRKMVVVWRCQVRLLHDRGSRMTVNIRQTCDLSPASLMSNPLQHYAQ